MSKLAGESESNLRKGKFQSRIMHLHSNILYV